MKNKKLYLMLAAIILLVGVILAFSAALVSSTIYNDNTGAIESGIGLHVVVTMLFILCSAVFLFLYIKNMAVDKSISTEHFALLGGFVLSGLFFSLASGYQGRASLLTDYREYVRSSPSGWLDEVLYTEWFSWLPDVAADFSRTATTWYVIMCIAVVATVVIATRVFQKAKN